MRLNYGLVIFTFRNTFVTTLGYHQRIFRIRCYTSLKILIQGNELHRIYLGFLISLRFIVLTANVYMRKLIR